MFKRNHLIIVLLGLVFAAQGAVVVDNPEMQVLSGSWSTGSGVSGFWGDDYSYSSSTGASVQWTPSIELENYYGVYVRYTSHANRTTNAVYSVAHMDGTSQVSVGQTANGGEWVYLGTFAFNDDDSGTITLTRGAGSGIVVADAVRLLLEPNNFTVDVDNPSATISGNWSASTSVSGYEGSDYLWIGTGSGGFVRYDLNVPHSGDYAIYTTYTAASSRSEDVEYLISHDGGTSSVYIDQTVDAPAWGERRYKYLGTYTLSSSSSPYVAVLQSSGGVTTADSVIARWYEGGPVETGRWDLVFCDEFEGSSLDTNKWEAQDEQIYSSQLYCSTRWKENVVVSNGLLRLLTQEENRSGELDPADYHSWQEYTTGSVRTTEPVAKYGFFEARMRYAWTNGQNNSFWTTTSYYQDHPEASMTRQDITFEGGTQTYLGNERVHLASQYVETNGYENITGSSYFAFEDFGDEFHIFGFEWDEDSIKWYVDGMHITTYSNEDSHYSTRVLFSTMLLSNSGLATNNFPLLDGASMDVDWVRVFQQTD